MIYEGGGGNHNNSTITSTVIMYRFIIDLSHKYNPPPKKNQSEYYH